MIERNILDTWLLNHGGVLVARSAIVHRNTYFGNDIIAKNSSLVYQDERGYVPVELWIMSMVEAENTLLKKQEGLTTIIINSVQYTLKELAEASPKRLFGDYLDSWPLTKILDIGGTAKQSSFGTNEIPPIPVHVHPRKTEAYFFPPIDVPPYNKELPPVTTRIGLREDVSQEEFMERLARFGKDDSMFELLNEFQIKPMTGWTVLEKTLHAPGPYITFEIQRPADDYANASWRFGEQLDSNTCKKKYEEHVLREGVRTPKEFIDSFLDWNHTTNQSLKDRFLHTPKIIDSTDSGTRYQIFFDMFYGEGWEIPSGKKYTISKKDVPQAGIVWSGIGILNGNILSPHENNEFLVTPGTELIVENTGDTKLFVFTVEPIRTP